MTVRDLHGSSKSSRTHCACNGLDTESYALKMHNNLDKTDVIIWKTKTYWLGVTTFSAAAAIAGGLIWSFLKSDWDRVEKRLEQHDSRLEKVVDVLSALAEKVSGLKASQEATKEATEHRLGAVEGELSDLNKKVDSIAQRPLRAEAEPSPVPTYKPPQRPYRPSKTPAKPTPPQTQEPSREPKGTASAFDLLR